MMNWRLILALSGFGLAMAFATVYFIPTKIEPFVWLPIFIVCAYFIQRDAPRRFFLHGFLVSIFNCVWITGTHIVLQTTYLARHAEEAAQYAKMYDQMKFSVTMAMLLTGPVIGVISGLVLGVLSLVASKIVKK